MPEPWARLALFRQWGCFWDMSRPVLLEKSPPNMVVSRMLEALWSRHGAGAPRGVVFVFITRHPIANALGHLQWQACKGMSVFELVTHWVAQHDTLAADLPKLARATLLKLEEWSADPEPALTRIFEGLGLAEPPPAEAARAAAAGVRANPNAKYESQYCADLQFAARRAAHGRLVESWASALPCTGTTSTASAGARTRARRAVWRQPRARRRANCGPPRPVPRRTAARKGGRDHPPVYSACVVPGCLASVASLPASERRGAGDVRA